MTRSATLSRLAVSLVAGFGLLLASLPAHAASTEDASRFVKAMGDKAIAIAAQKNISDAQRQQKLENLFAGTVDIEWVSRFVLGKYWRTATPEQKTRYMQNYKKFLLKHYTANFNDYTNESFRIVDARQDAPNEFTLHTEILRPGKESLLVDYRLRAGAGGFKLFDIIVEGVSLITTQREEFGSAVGRKGLDYLIDQLAGKSDEPNPSL